MYLFLLLLCSGIAAAQSSFNLQSLDPLLRDSVSGINPGVSLTVAVEGRVVYRSAFGAYEPDRAVPIASASKWLASSVILALVDEGKIRLDDRASRYVTLLTGDKTTITIRQLLSHTSGIVADSPCLFSRSTTLAACADEIAQEPLLFPPGADFSYGNSAMQVAGRAAEIASGKSWNQLFQEKLATPLGFKCTRTDGVGSLENPTIANGVVSCAADYTAFLQMIVDGGVFKGQRVLSTAALAEMMKDQTNGVPILESIYKPFGNLDPQLPLLRYGLGVWREKVSPSGQVLELSSQGAFGFSPWVDFDRHLTGVLSVQSSQDAIMDTYLQVKARIRDLVPVWESRTLFATNGASFVLEPMAPGTVFTIFGAAIGPSTDATLKLDSPTKVATQLSGFRVLVNGIPAPLIYAGWGQISAVTPFALEGRSSAVVQLEKDGTLGPRTTIAVAPATPALFTFDSSGRGRIVALNQDGTVNSPTRPAPRGSVVVLYATGLGQTSPPLTDGQVPSAAAQSVQPVFVSIGGVQAQVLYAGVAPGTIAGVYQINAVVSPFTPSGPDMPVSLQAGVTLSTAPVTVSIQ